MRKVTKIAPVALLAFAVAACQSTGPKQTGGTLVGAGLGGLAGSQIGSGKGQLAAVALGTLAGAYLGSEVGKSLDRADMAYAQRNTQRSLETAPSGTTSTWRNPDSGHSGSITPQPAFQRADGAYCREFQQTVTVDGRTESAYGKACRQPDGSWKIVN